MHNMHNMHNMQNKSHHSDNKKSRPLKILEHATQTWQQQTLHQRASKCISENGANGVGLHVTGCPSSNLLKKQFPVNEIMTCGTKGHALTATKEQTRAQTEA